MRAQRFFVGLITTVMLWASFSSARAENAEEYYKVIRNTAVAVAAGPCDAGPMRPDATGYISRIPLDDQWLIFVSNRHVFTGRKSLTLLIPTFDTLQNIINSYCVNLPLFTPTNDSLFITSAESGSDVAITLFHKDRLGSENMGYFNSLPKDMTAMLDTVFVGQPVIFSGYPLGMTINGIEPLLRRGSIAGVDKRERIIYIDASAFPGSSGSPVFIDLQHNINQKHLRTLGTKQSLIGIIAGYVPFVKELYNPQTGLMEMMQHENSGLAKVMPAEDISKLAQIAVEVILPRMVPDTTI